jgi:hypothetical protein
MRVTTEEGTKTATEQDAAERQALLGRDMPKSAVTTTARGARVLGLGLQASSELLDALVESGYAKRTQDLTDRRKVVIDLTAKGRAAAESLVAGGAVDPELASITTPRQRAGIREFLLAMTDVGEWFEERDQVS